jgi:hypothetical protein
MTCYGKALPLAFLHPASTSLDFTASSAYLQNNMYKSHNNKNELWISYKSSANTSQSYSLFCISSEYSVKRVKSMQPLFAS